MKSTDCSKYLDCLIDKLENSIFGSSGTQPISSNNISNSFTSQTDDILPDFLTHLEFQAFFSLLFNVFLVAILSTYVSSNFFTCWSCSPTITIWLIFMGILSTILIIPKIILLRKLFRVEEAADSSQASYYMSAYGRSKAFTFNEKIGNALIAAYLIGLINVNYIEIKAETCTNLFGLVAFLSLIFLITIILGFWKAINNLFQSSKFQSLCQSLSRAFQTSGSCLQEIKYSKYQKSFCTKDHTSCCICYESYEMESILKIMRCQGAHAFHKDCIDKWLVKSTRCPQCNLNALGQSR